ncbi:MAG: GxxExxY protein [archaeon]
MKHEELTEKIIGVFYRVYNELGYGFLEKIYERALAYEFKVEGLSFERQVPISVFYKGENMGDYYADFIVDGRVIIEIKAIKEIGEAEGVQLLNYLKATGKEVGLVLNFGREAEIKRKVNSRICLKDSNADCTD